MYCVKCGVKLDDSAEVCPLCGTPAWHPETAPRPLEASAGTPALYSDRIAKSAIRVNRIKYTRTTGFVIFVAMLAALIVNLCVSGNVSWSKYALISLCELWALMVIPVKFTGKRPAGQIALVLALITSIYLLLLDWFLGFSMWSLYAVLGVLLVWVYGGLPFAQEYYFRRKLRIHLSLCILASAVVLFAYDLLSGRTGFSLYTTFSLACLWCYVFLPLLVRSPQKVYLCLGADYLITFFSVLMFFQANGLGDLSLTFALALVTLLFASALLVLAIAKISRFSLFGIVGLSFLFAAGFILCLNLLINRCFHEVVLLNLYSIVTAACLVPVAVFLLVLEKNAKLKEIVTKKLFL